MADIHVLAATSDQSWSVVFHIPVPDAENSVGTNWRTALVNSGLGDTSLSEGSGPGQITTIEKAAINAGEVCEHHATFEIDGQGVDVTSRRASLRAMYATTKAEVLARLQRTLKFFGHTESET